MFSTVWQLFARCRHVHKQTSGIMYVAVGADHAEQAKISAHSVKAVMPDAFITLFTSLRDETIPPFDCVVHIVSCGDPFEDKIRCIRNSPHHKTLFLDSDTFVCTDLSALWDVLDCFDLAATHASNRIAHDDSAHSDLLAIPQWFPEFNTGVLLFRKSCSMRKFLAKWISEHRRLNGRALPSKDQAAFRFTLYDSPKIHFFTLVPEYNCRIHMGGFINQPVKVFHARCTEAGFKKITEATSEALGGGWNARVVHLERKLYVPGQKTVDLDGEG